MPSNARKGAYYKARAKRWLEAQGYQVGDLERVFWIQRGPVRMPVKRDQFASDLIAVSARDVVFVQVKGGEQARGNGTFPVAGRQFAEFVFPPGVRRWVVAFAPRSRAPRVIEFGRVGGS